MYGSHILMSFSAPKILGSSNSPIFNFNPKTYSIKTSPGESPSCFQINNFPIESSMSQIKGDFFFNSELSLRDMQEIADIITIEEEDDTMNLSGILNNIIQSKSASNPPYVLAISAKTSRKNEEYIKSKADKNRDSREVPITLPEIKLQMPPVRPKNLKRQQRKVINNEEVICKSFSGELKFYNLKKRFGFIKVNNQDFDAFICEDDILLSGANLRKFKDDVYNKKKINLEFDVIKYVNDQGTEMQKAVNIKLD